MRLLVLNAPPVVVWENVSCLTAFQGELLESYLQAKVMSFRNPGEKLKPHRLKTLMIMTGPDELKLPGKLETMVVRIRLAKKGNDV
jgi:hypothetical protein